MRIFPPLFFMDTCDSCGEEIVRCDTCEGLSCSNGCPDREFDCCMCDEDDIENTGSVDGDDDEVV
jgi:hypothetical protein